MVSYRNNLVGDESDEASRAILRAFLRDAFLWRVRKVFLFPPIPASWGMREWGMGYLDIACRAAARARGREIG